MIVLVCYSPLDCWSHKPSDFPWYRNETFTNDYYHFQQPHSFKPNRYVFVV